MTTKQAIISQLKENTGQSMCDSGGAYGRNWERNQKVDFDKTPALKYSFDVWEKENWNFNASLSLYHFLMAFCEYDEDLNSKLNAFAELPENKDESWHSISRDFAAKIGNEVGKPVNTYNFDNLLSQIIEFVSFTYKGENFVSLQVHNGCDARAGYSKPIIYAVKEPDYFYMAMTRLSVDCPKCKVSWDSDNSGYSFQDNGASPKFKDLKNYTAKELKINKNGAATCPCCKKGKLEAYPQLEY